MVMATLPKLLRTLWRSLGYPLDAKWCVVDLSVHISNYRDEYTIHASRYTRRPDGTYLMKRHQYRDRYATLDGLTLGRLMPSKGALVSYVSTVLERLATLLFDPKPDGWRLFGRGRKPMAPWRGARMAAW